MALCVFVFLLVKQSYSCSQEGTARFWQQSIHCFIRGWELSSRTTGQWTMKFKIERLTV